MDTIRPLVGVRLVLSGGKSAAATTDANGYYAFSDLPAGGNYSVAPAGAKMNFTPSSRSLSNLSRDESADFHGLAERETYRISGRVTEATRPLGGVRLVLGGGKSAATTTDGNGNYTFTDLPAGGTYVVTATGNINFSPSSRSFSNLVRNESANFFGVLNVDPTEPPVEIACNETDRLRARNAILGRFSGAWRRMIEGERRRIIAENIRGGLEPTAELGPIEYQTTFFKNCEAASVTARYAWQVKADHPAGLKIVTVPRGRKFICGKLGGLWLCS